MSQPTSAENVNARAEAAALRRRYRRLGATVLAFWLALVGGFVMLVNGWNQTRVQDLAFEVVKLYVDKDLSYRQWAASMGGLYVPVTPELQPNPWLQVPKRDVETTDGLELTMVNPAWMIRMVQELAAPIYGVKAHITSLNPIRPANAPDAWEAAALRGFTAADQYRFELTDGPDGPVYRYMRPLYAAASCLKCHAIQGYREGELRGGLAVSLPARQFTEIEDKLWRDSLMLAGLAAVAGGVAITGLTGGLIRRRMGQMQAREALDRERGIYRVVVETSTEGFMKLDRTGRILEANGSYCRILGYEMAEVVGAMIADFEIDQSAAEIAEKVSHLAQVGAMHFETRHRAKDGHEVWFEVSATCPDPESGEIYAFLHDVTERRNQAEAIAAALGEKQVLLRELYHRTKNNMHVVTGLLQLQADGLPGEPRLQEHFQVAINRIYSMALVHQKLYQSEDLSRIDLPEYIRDLAANLLEAEQPAAGPVHFELSAEQAMPEPIESAVPVGIILNELVTNSLKYAFAGRGGGTIRIKLHRDADGGTDIDYRDDGQGLDTQAAREGGLGISLIRNLSQQLLGTVEIGNAPDGGFRCRLRYPRH